MTATELWDQLKSILPSEVARVANQCGPIAGSSRDLVELRHDRRSSASMADEKLAYHGNSYEQLSQDFSHILEAAERLSGQKARFRWERN